jgi:hypothetical protein
VTAAAHDYDDLHRMVDRLSPAQADAVRTLLRQLVGPDPETTGTATDQSEPRRYRRMTVAGITSAGPDLAERSEEILREPVDRQE